MSDLTRGIYRRIYAGFIWGDRICEVPIAAEAWFWRLHAVADDYGNLPADEVRLSAEVKGRRDARSSDILRACADLTKVGLIYPYESAGDKFFHIADFEEMQPAPKNGRRVRKCPPHPPCGIRVNPGESGCDQEIQASHSHSHSHSHSPNPQGGEVGVVESTKRERRKASDWKAQATPGFLAFWEAYPSHRRIDPRKCLLTWSERQHEARASEIVAVVRGWSLSEQWQRENGKFIPMSTTFLNQDRMETVPPPDAAKAIRIADAKALRTRLFNVARMGGVPDERAGPMADDAIRRRLFTAEDLAGTDGALLELWKERTKGAS